MAYGLVQLIGGAFQDTLQNPIAFGTLVLTLSQTDNQPGYIYSNLSPFTVSEVCQGLTFKIPLDSNGNVITSPAYSVFANDVLSPHLSYYMATVYDARGQRVWGPNPQQINVTLSPFVGTFDLGTWVPGQISEVVII